MGNFAFGERSKKNLTGVHPDLVKVATKALELSQIDFTVTEGLRTKERQAQLMAAGASKTMNSRHITGHAIDIAPIIAGEVRWDWPPFQELSKAFKLAAKEENVPIVWGGDWVSFKDGPHFELDRRKYP
jgi:peptidoglycan L-alanyl-D-glutamate endopeptidase CwlK